MSAESLSQIASTHQERRECDYCKESLVILRVKGIDRVERAVAMEVVSGNRHVCWNLPEDANLIVIDD